MGKKKKGANKMAKMSEEERLRYLAARADVEEEAKRRKQQIIALFMKNKLKREDAFTRLNMAKINQEWRGILRQLKCDELRSEIRCAEKLCELSVDRKNQIIQRLLSDLDVSEELYCKNLQSHAQNVLRLQSIHEERLKFWSTFYATEKGKVLKEFNDDMKSKKICFEKSKGELECVHYAIDDEIRRDRTRNHSKAEKQLNEFRDMMSIRLDSVTKTREAVMEELWREFQSVLNSYSSYTQDFYDDYLESKRRDEIETQVSQSYYLEIAKSAEQITDLRLEINSKRKRHETNKSHLLEVKKDLQDIYRKLKVSLVQVRMVDNTKIRELVTYANSAKKVLERQKHKATGLMHLATMCRKFETETQRYSFEQCNQALHMDYGKVNFNTATYKNLEQMSQFWDRYNKVRLDCACLAEEKAALERENNNLKMRMKNYLVDISMHNSSSSNNALRLGNRPTSMTIARVERREPSRIRTATAQSHRTRPMTCIEGNLSVAIRSRKLMSRVD